MNLPFTFLVFDGEHLSANPRAPGRRLRADPRAVRPGSRCTYAHVCALPDRHAGLRYDEPEFQAARRDAIAWWIPLLGEAFVCITTLSIDASRTAGAITVAHSPQYFGEDPFGRIFAGTTVSSDLFAPVPPPAGPVIERSGESPWPAEGF
jgi:hypothetical protein